MTTPVPQANIRLEVEGLIELLQSMEAQVLHYRTLLSESFPYLEINYEDFINHREQEAKRVEDFLHLGHLGHLTSDLVKFNSDHLRDILINYNEVVTTLSQTRFAHYLDAPDRVIKSSSNSRKKKRKKPKHKVWSIGIYSGANPIDLRPEKRVMNPVITHADVADVQASGVADPFMVCEKGSWFMFFEVMNVVSKRGEIGLATSPDGLKWQYQQIVLQEPFHLSYPQVFKWKQAFYMLPETRQAGDIRIYKATKFPCKWSFEQTLIAGEYADASLVRHRRKWWLFSRQPRDILTLHVANGLFGPWYEHPKSPILHDKHIARPGGRVTVFQDKIIRYAQDRVPDYGSRVWALEVERLSPNEYRERPASDQPVIEGSGQGWNAKGMHHVDAVQVGKKRWLACVDGFQMQTIS